MTTSRVPEQRVLYVVEMTVGFTSLAQAREQAPQELAEHLRRSTQLHERGEVLLAGAFLAPEPGDEHLHTMAICTSQDAADRFVAGDPFVRSGHVTGHRIRPWANMFAR
ncbi:MAG TPA: YciI family protein [Rugosimonospora sp.]|nr:YciI family protein [Rugosimonospora sp.]